jgi:hypothetical protein
MYAEAVIKPLKDSAISVDYCENQCAETLHICRLISKEPPANDLFRFFKAFNFNNNIGCPMCNHQCRARYVEGASNK